MILYAACAGAIAVAAEAGELDGTATVVAIGDTVTIVVDGVVTCDLDRFGIAAILGAVAGGFTEVAGAVWARKRRPGDGDGVDVIRIYALPGHGQANGHPHVLRTRELHSPCMSDRRPPGVQSERLHKPEVRLQFWLKGVEERDSWPDVGVAAGGHPHVEFHGHQPGAGRHFDRTRDPDASVVVGAVDDELQRPGAMVRLRLIPAH